MCGLPVWVNVKPFTGRGGEGDEAALHGGRHLTARLAGRRRRRRRRASVGAASRGIMGSGTADPSADQSCGVTAGPAARVEPVIAAPLKQLPRAA